MYLKKTVTLALTLLLLSSYCIIGFDLTQPEKREAHLSTSVIQSKDDPYIRTRFAGGDGTKENPYQISNVTQLQDMNLDLSANYTLTNNIDASETTTWDSGKGFESIGDDYKARFIGKIDGQGYQISDLYIERPTENPVGLFECIGNGGHISNISIVDSQVVGDWNVGVMVGLNYGIVQNCLGTGYMSGEWSVGGLVGENRGMVNNCLAIGNVWGGFMIGGLVGENTETVQNSSATGNVNGESDVGGLVGWNTGVVQNSSSAGNVSGEYGIGGLVGYNSDTIQNCFSNTNISGYAEIGGLVGLNYERIENSFYCINTTTINRRNVISRYGILKKQFDQWIVNGKTLNIDDYLSKIIGSDYYNISNTSDIKEMLPFAAYGEYNFKQTADIDMLSEPNLYIPILNSGKYDGSGYLISNMKVTIREFSKIGFFGILGKKATITNVTLIKNNIHGFDYIGGLVGHNYGEIKNCTISGNIAGRRDVGGLVGVNTGIIENSSSRANTSGDRNIGGLVGSNYINIINSFSMGNIYGIIGWNFSNVGGFVGYNHGTIKRCITKTNVFGNYGVGGFVGENSGGFEGGIIKKSSTTANVSGIGYVGGFVGENSGAIKESYSDTNVSGEYYVGGFVGLYSGGSSLFCIIENCYSKSIVFGNFSVGGFVGNHTNRSIRPGVFKNCYSIGKLYGNYSIGGFLGGETSPIINNSYWDIEASGISSSGAGKGIMTFEMMTKSTFTEAGWDFGEIWAINEYVEPPHFQWEKRPSIVADDSDNDSIPDIIDDFPLDPSASLDLDNDKKPDRWNPGMNQSDSTSTPPLELDIYPNDPENKAPDEDGPEIPTDSSSKTWIWISVTVVVILFNAIIIVVSVKGKRKPPENEEKDNLGRVNANKDR